MLRQVVGADYGNALTLLSVWRLVSGR